MTTLENFKKLGLSESTLTALKRKGFEEPTEIQEKVIPIFLNTKKDIVGQAQTGTGKTAAFGLPLIELLDEHKKNIQVLILTPTRELAIQVSEEINSLKGRKRLNVAPIYGGQSIDLQLRSLQRGVHIVVGTPGRVLDHIRRKSMHLGNVSHMILDEADEMLNMGFIDDVEEILKETGSDKRILLFSATMPENILRLSKKYMREYEFISVVKKQLTKALTDQIYFEVNRNDKFEALCRIIDIEHEFYGLIFCRTKIDSSLIANKLIDRGYEAEAIHGDISQNQRERTLSKFKRKKINILVATDVAARGIDINDLTHVINYSLPQDPESYVHRIGRTGRAGKEGTAITFITTDEYRQLLYIQKVANAEIKRKTIPKVEDIINIKKSKIKSAIQTIIDSNQSKEYALIAEELLAENSAEDIISSILQHMYSQDLNEKKYSTIKDVSIDRKGITRLFVARGRAEEMTPKKLVDFITEETSVSPDKIRDVRVFENFSFLAAPFEEAELILEVFKRKKKGRKSLVELAREKDSSKTLPRKPDYNRDRKPDYNRDRKSGYSDNRYKKRD